MIVAPAHEHALAREGRVLWLHDQPYLAFALCSRYMEEARAPRVAAGVHASAIVAPDARVAINANIGAYVVIGPGAEIGSRVEVGSGCVIGANVRIGARSRLHPKVTLYDGAELGEDCIVHSGAVVGCDGFGFAPSKSGWIKIPQIGRVRIGNDVEIGANTTIDRGALDDTVIGNGVKLDNQIQIAHNVRIGDHTAIAACVGIAGSVTIGSRCMIGGAAMISGHLEIADDVNISGGSVVSNSISTPGRYTGVFPIQPHRQWERNAALARQLGDLRKRILQLERVASSRAPSTEQDPS